MKVRKVVLGSVAVLFAILILSLGLSALVMVLIGRAGNRQHSLNLLVLSKVAA